MCEGVDRVLRALARGIGDVAEYPSRLDRRGWFRPCRQMPLWPAGSSLSVAHLAPFCLPSLFGCLFLASDRFVLNGGSTSFGG
jgi:hypothetical protein